MFLSNKPIKLPGSDFLHICDVEYDKKIVFDACGVSWGYPLWLFLTDKYGYLIPEDEFTPEKFDGRQGLGYDVWSRIYHDDWEYSTDELPRIIKKVY